MSNPTELALSSLESAFGPGAVQRQGRSAMVNLHGHQVEVTCRVEHADSQHEAYGGEPHHIMQVSLPITLPGPLTMQCHRRANTSLGGRVEIQVNAPTVGQRTIVTGHPREVIQRAFQSPELVSFFETFPAADNMLLSDGKIRVARTISITDPNHAAKAKAILGQVAKFLPVPTELPAVSPPLTPEYMKTLVEGLVTSHRVLTTAYQEHLAQLQNQGGPNAREAFIARVGQEVVAEDSRRQRSSLLFNLIFFGAVLAMLLLMAGIFGAILLF